MTLRIIPERYSPHVQGLLRIATALLFLQHGTAKLFGFPHVFDNVRLMSLMGAAGVLELVGGALLLVGLFTRPVAFLLSGEMAVAYFFFHAQEALWPILNKGELAALYCFVFLFFSAAGPGKFALDRQ
ncbi:DoxX family protein [Methylocystis parvus]|uniref:DoxX family protein n=1 Tax=Methylocystis parvus TaxID=134 RepID=A0A6B8MC30_9HYPH|nr:DoxX family protein [Methylocystis parvus]QGM98893.1 DoxX family protein [Methylocystis parvus]WBK00751.1 DoxX family protein [Methylocystis parvus OBBP]